MPCTIFHHLNCKNRFPEQTTITSPGLAAKYSVSLHLRFSAILPANERRLPLISQTINAVPITTQASFLLRKCGLTLILNQNRKIYMSETWNKKERERKKKQKKKEKLEKRQERKSTTDGSNDLQSMLAYVDENGDLSSTPVDPRKKVVVNAEDIRVSVPRQDEIEAEDTMQVGVVTNFKTDKGYGFIRNLETQQSYFFHVNSLMDPVKENTKVNFEVEKTLKGLSAVNVRVVKT
jgi:cold shock CspA family protein